MLACVCLLSYWLIGPSWCQTRPSCCEGQWVGDGLRPSLGGISWIDQDRVIAEPLLHFKRFVVVVLVASTRAESKARFHLEGTAHSPNPDWIQLHHLLPLLSFQSTPPKTSHNVFSEHAQFYNYVLSRERWNHFAWWRGLTAACSVRRSGLLTAPFTLLAALLHPFCFLLLCLLEQIRLLCGVTSGVWPLGPLIPPSLALGSPRTLGP